MKKRGICLLLALLMTLSLLPFGALAASADDLKYTIIDGAAESLSFRQPSKAVRSARSAPRRSTDARI